MRQTMRPIVIAAALAASGALAGCSSTGGGGGDSGLSQSLDFGNYRQSSNTNGTQTRPDVNRAYTQPVLPSIVNRGQ